MNWMFLFFLALVVVIIFTTIGVNIVMRLSDIRDDLRRMSGVLSVIYGELSKGEKGIKP